jgi:hypothetical protein
MTGTSGTGSGSRSGFEPEDGTGDSVFQQAVRGDPRPGEDWDAQGLIEVLIARAEAAGFRGTVSELDSAGRQLVMVTTKDAGAFVRAPLMKVQCRDWDSGGAGQDWEGWTVEQIRFDILDRLINDLVERGSVSTQEVLGQPYQSAFSVHHRLDAALGLWWQARMDEGQTAESARLLLNLLAHPSVLPMVAYDILGGPYLLPLQRPRVLD